MKQLAMLNPENVREKEVLSWRIREAARAIVFDSDSKIAIQHVRRDAYFKLPGGGIEEGESKTEALMRECLEETGCQIEILQEVGSITELRRNESLRQISYCYLAKVVGTKDQPHFTHKEQKEGSELVWLTYDEALYKLANNSGTTLEAQLYMVPRDLLFLEKAKEYTMANK